MPRAPALLLLLLVAPLAGASPFLVPQQGDADTSATGTLVASVSPFVDERFAWTEGHRDRVATVPDVAYDRVVLVWSSWQDRDPWDRRFGVSLGGVEVLRGTTPRAAFEVEKDVTEFASLMAPGEDVLVGVHLGSWVGGGILATVRLEFYVDALVQPAAFDAIHPVARWAYLTGGASAGADVTFGASAPSRVALHFVTSGHGQDGEFWWMRTPPAVASFRILVDGEEVARGTAMPYVYALIGFSPSYVTDNVVHPVMWWSAFQVADRAGAHVGVGEVPAYRAEIDAAQLYLFTGARRVEVVQDTGAGSWVTSVAVLVDA